jgi:hypothetical protein
LFVKKDENTLFKSETAARSVAGPAVIFAALVYAGFVLENLLSMAKSPVSLRHPGKSVEEYNECK